MKRILTALIASVCLVSMTHAADAASSLAAPAGQMHKAVAFKIDKSDVAGVEPGSDTLTIVLKPAAAKRLAAITAANTGKSLAVYYQDFRVLQARIHAAMRSGLIYVHNPSPALKRKLGAHQAAS